MNITTGLVSVAVAAPVVGGPSPFSRVFRSLTRTTVCWRAVRHCGDAWWSTAPGKKRLLRSKTLTACPIPPRSVAGPTDWTRGWRIVNSPVAGNVALLHSVAGSARIELEVTDFKGVRAG